MRGGFNGWSDMTEEHEHGERFDIESDTGRSAIAAVGFDFDRVCSDLDGEGQEIDAEKKDAARIAVYKTIEFLIGGGNGRNAYNANTIANRVLTLSILFGIVKPQMQKELAKQIGLGPAAMSKEKRRIRNVIYKACR
jgi:hypothetical protein